MRDDGVCKDDDHDAEKANEEEAVSLTDGSVGVDERLTLLLQWLDEHGVELSSKLVIARTVVDLEQSGCGVYLRSSARHEDCSLEPGEIVATITKKALLSIRTVSASQQAKLNTLHERLQAHPDERIRRGSSTVSLAAALAYELSLGSASGWSGFLQSLPTAFECVLPGFWDDTEASAWLRGTDAAALLEYQGSDAATMEACFLNVVLSTLAQFGVTLTWSLFKHAYCLVSSRAFWVDDYHGLSMVPLADAFNHHFDPNVTLQADTDVCRKCGRYQSCEHDRPRIDGDSPRAYLSDAAATSTGDDTSEAVEMICTAPPTGSKEVFNTYGRLPNAFLLVNYGFLLEANDDDRVCWFNLAAVCRHFTLRAGYNPGHIETAWRHDMLKAKPNHASDARVVFPAILDEHSFDIVPLHELLYIDADASLSSPLSSLLGILAARCDPPTDLATAVVTLCSGRLSELHRPHDTIENLLDLAQSADTPYAARLAIMHSAEQRSLLRACVHNWQEGGDSGDDA